MERDLYGVLRLSKGATAEEIKVAYRRLAFALHPDRNTALDAAERFREVCAAYIVLSDQEKKAQFDLSGEINLHGTEFDVGDFGNISPTMAGGGLSREEVDNFAEQVKKQSICLYDDDGLTACGRDISSPLVFSMPEPRMVTCKVCLEKIAKQVKLG